MTIDFRDTLVRKPWGYEYLMYENQQLGLWLLHLEAGAATSLHCHPRKKTGLVVLSGEARLSFLNEGMDLKPLSRIMIRPGLFHSTKATSADGLTLLEVETPRDKEDLVRLEDQYGREAQPYEGVEATEPLRADLVQLGSPAAGEVLQYQIGECNLKVIRLKAGHDCEGFDPDSVIMLLEGGLYTDAGDPILVAGDVVAPPTLVRLARSFPVSSELTLLFINRL